MNNKTLPTKVILCTFYSEKTRLGHHRALNVGNFIEVITINIPNSHNSFINFLLLAVSIKPNKILLIPTVDNGDYPENSPYFHKTIKKVIGKFKDEAPSIAITQFIG